MLCQSFFPNFISFELMHHHIYCDDLKSQSAQKSKTLVLFTSKYKKSKVNCFDSNCKSQLMSQFLLLLLLRVFLFLLIQKKKFKIKSINRSGECETIDIRHY